MTRSILRAAIAPQAPSRPRAAALTAAALLAAALSSPAAAATPPAGGAAGAIARGDALWERRAEGRRGDRAAPGPIAEAAAAYEEALAADPAGLAPTWRLLRALYFQGDYGTAGRDAKARLYERGKEACGAALARLEREVSGFEGVEGAAAEALQARLGGRPDAAKLFFWCAVNWGLWGENHGKLAAARAGVASKVRDFCLAAIALDGRAEQGGGHRILGRLHSEAPAIPFVTGWVDRDTAIAELRRANAIAPDDPINRIFLAEALLDHGDARQEAEAWTILTDLGRLEPRPEHAVEDARVLRLAREHLERRGG
jgi:tetratricopeptide (TPR) repeat protein